MTDVVSSDAQDLKVVCSLTEAVTVTDCSSAGPGYRGSKVRGQAEAAPLGVWRGFNRMRNLYTPHTPVRGVEECEKVSLSHQRLE